MNIIIALVILFLVVYLAKIILAEITLPQPVKTVVWVLLGVIFLIKLLDLLGVVVPNVRI